MNKKTIDDSTECFKTCARTLQYCLERGDEHVNPDHINLLMDCSDICKSATVLMLRRSDYAAEICELCAEICERCADSCETFENDEAMQECAKVCRECADSCHDVA